MASVMDTIYISLGLKTDDFTKSMNKAKENIEKTSQSLNKGADQASAKAFGQLANVARMVAAPLAGALSIGSMIKTYFSGVAQVAQMTGAYSTKLEEWRKKRALLNRVTKEDIQLYKKSREAITKFQIVMDDLGAKIARQTSPAIKYFVELLEKVAKWIDKYSNDIVRFLKLVAVVIGVALLPQLYKMAAALLMNPLVWLIGIIGFLLLALDDLIVYLKGGNSAFEKFWKFIGLTKGDTALLNSVLKGLTFFLWKVVAPITAIMLSKYAFKGLTGGALAFVQILKNMASGLASVIVFFGNLAKAIMLCTLNMIRLGVAALANPITWIILAIVAAVALLVAGIYALWKNWDKVSAWITEKCEVISNWFKNLGETLKEWFTRGIDAVKSSWDSFKNSINNGYNTVKSWFIDLGQSIKNSFDLSNISAKFEEFYNKVVGWVSDIGKSFKDWISDKIENVKTTWTEFCQSIETWYNKLLGWFGDIGKKIKEAFSFDSISKKLDGLMSKLNPANWKLFGGGDEEQNLNASAKTAESPEKLAATAESAERAVQAQTMGGSNNTMYSSPTINLNSPSPSAVREAFTQSGASTENYGDYIAQMARSGT